MARRPFIRRKKNETKNQEAIDVFNTFNRLAPSTRNKYIKSIKVFADFLLVHRKSLWDTDFEDLKKFLLESENDQARSIISTFYRVLIDSGEFKGENPVILLNRIEREERQKQIKSSRPISRAASVIQELDEEEQIEEIKVKKPEKKRRIGKRIMVLSDLDKLVQKAAHIRDRAILEYLYATGSQIQEIVNLNISDVDLIAKQVTIHQSPERYRTLILPSRTVNFLKIYERWRRRQLSPSQAYFITKSTRKRMSDTSISTWLARVQRNNSKRERWTSMDFRKRALLQHYWVTRDLIAIARFGGYKRPESALNLISEVLNDQGVDSIDALASLPEFEALKGERKKLARVGADDQLTITIQLDREEMDIIRNSGLTPTQAVRTIISLKDLYGAFSPGGAPVAMGEGSSTKPATTSTKVTLPVSAKPGETPKISLPQPGGPGKGPSLGGSGGPSLGSAPSGGPSLGSSTSGGPSLGSSTGPSSSGPSLSSAPSGILDVKLTSGPKKPAVKPPPSKPAGGGPMDQLSELKQILARRRAMSQETDENEEAATGAERPGLGGKILDNETDDDEDKKDEKEEEVPDMPDFEF